MCDSKSKCFMIHCCSKMNVSIATSVILLVIIEIAASAQHKNANLTMWRQHRREKRFLIFQNVGVCKLVCGVTLPVDLYDKKPWRQLVMLYNLQFQFPQPPTPIYWWNKWQNRKFPEPTSDNQLMDYQQVADYKDDAQIFLYEFIVEYLNQRGTNGKQCLQLAICENAQIHKNYGIFAELLHRILQPHRSVPEPYLHAYHLGKYAADCQANFPHAKNCLLDKFLYVREE